MTIKVKDSTTTVPVPASPAQITQIQTDLNIATPDTVTTIVSTNSSLGALAPAVNTLINTASTSDRARANHTGFDPAANILLSNGLTLQAYIDALEIRLTTLGSTAPVNTVQPAAPTGTLSVGNTLTAQTGTWTGASTFNYVWYRVNTTTGLFTAIGSTASTYVAQAADSGFKIAVSVAGVSAAGVTAAPVISAVTASAISATLPTISVAPAVTPSGTQAVGVLLTSTTGTWNNNSGAVYTYQWTFNGAAITGATNNTYTIITGQESGSIVCKVLATTPQGPAASAASSNTITVASTPALTQTAAPILASTVTVDTGGTITNATWSGGTPTYINTRIYITEGTGGTTTPYATLTTNPAIYTPEADGNSFLLSATGLSSLTGKTVSCDQQWSLGGTTYTTTKSGTKTIQAASATLATTVDNTGMNWTQNSPITAIRPVSATGGTTPYTFGITPSTLALPAGLALNTSTGFISGTPTAVTSGTYSITVTDAVGGTSTKTFSASVSSASSVPILAYIDAEETLAASGSHSEGDWNVQLLGTAANVTTVSETNGITGTGNITGPSTVGASTKRFARIVDPTDATKHALYFASNSNDPSTQNHRNRVELSIVPAGGLSKTGSYWIKCRKYTPTVRFNQTGGILLQVHNSYAPSTVTGPFELGYDNSGGIWPPIPMVYASVYWSDQDDPGVGGYNLNQWYPYISDSSGVGGVSYASGIPTGGTPYTKYGPTAFGSNPKTDSGLPTVSGPADSRSFPLNQWNDWVVFYKGDPSGYTGQFKVWLNSIQVVNLTGIKIGTPSHSGAAIDYIKCGLDSAGGFTNGTTGAWEMLKHLYIVNDNASGGPFSFAQIQALGQ